MIVYRGEIYYADLSPVVGSEQGGLRPVLIIQNDMGNRHSPTVIAVALTSRIGKRKYPTNVDFSSEDTGLKCESRVCCEQVRTLDKSRLREKVGCLSAENMKKVNAALRVSFAL